MKALAVEEARAEAEAAALEAGGAAAEEAAGRRPPQVDVSKLAHYRYSKIRVSAITFFLF